MTELSPINPELERFLFAPLHENGDAPLSVLSVLARQDIDPGRRPPAWPSFRKITPSTASLQRSGNRIASDGRPRRQASWLRSSSSCCRRMAARLRPGPGRRQQYHDVGAIWGHLLVGRGIRDHQPASGQERQPAEPRWRCRCTAGSRAATISSGRQGLMRMVCR